MLGAPNKDGAEGAPKPDDDPKAAEDAPKAGAEEAPKAEGAEDPKSELLVDPKPMLLDGFAEAAGPKRELEAPKGAEEGFEGVEPKRVLGWGFPKGEGPEGPGLGATPKGLDGLEEEANALVDVGPKAEGADPKAEAD